MSQVSPPSMRTPPSKCNGIRLTPGLNNMYRLLVSFRDLVGCTVYEVLVDDPLVGENGHLLTQTLFIVLDGLSDVGKAQR